MDGPWAVCQAGKRGGFYRFILRPLYVVSTHLLLVISRHQQNMQGNCWCPRIEISSCLEDTPSQVSQAP